MNQLDELTAVAKEHNCTVINAEKIIHIFKDGKPIYEFTKEEITYYQGSMNNLFEEVKEKL